MLVSVFETTFLRLRYPVEFSFIYPIILNRVDSITDLGVVMDSRVSFSGHIDVMVGKALAMLRFLIKLSSEFRNPYSFITLFVLHVRPKVEYACYVWRRFNDMHISRIERVQGKFVRYALRGLRWTDMHDTWNDVL
jgi:hypothetical protein